ncbi:MAG TPA: hypothetical protein VFI31_17065 [Pirellulales bacterium]|nr:hypothetical protein [Pirellulales bacterium]
MGLRDFFAALCNIPSVAELSRQVAQRSYGLVRESVGIHVLAYSRAEARGYVRAKAGAVIRAEARYVAQRHPSLTSAALAHVINQASDRVVQSVLADLNRERTRRSVSRAA